MSLIADPSTWADWQPEIVSSEGPAPLTAGDVVDGHASMLGFQVAGRSVAIEVGPRVLEEDVIVGVRMIVRYSVASTDAGTVVTRRLTAELPGGPMGRLLSFFLKRRLKTMQRRVLDELSALPGTRSSLPSSP